MIALVAAALVWHGSAIMPNHANPHRWTRTNIALATSFSISLDVDRATTLELLRRGHPESNAVLGRWPRESQVNAYMVACWAGAMAIAALLPTRERSYWLGGLTVLELWVDRKQLRLGVGLRL